MDLLQELLTHIMENNRNINDVDLVCVAKALIYVMQYYYYSDDFVIEAVKLKNTMYLGFRQDYMPAPPNDKLRAPYFPPATTIKALGFKTIFNIKLNRANVNELRITEPKRLSNTSNKILEKKMHLKWLIMSDLLGEKIRMIHVKKYYMDEWINDEFIFKDDLHKKARFNGRNLLDCYTYLAHFLRQVKEDMREVVDPRKVFSYKFQRKSIGTVTIQKVMGIVNYVPIAFEVSERDILPEQYINYVNNYDNN